MSLIVGANQDPHVAAVLAATDGRVTTLDAHVISTEPVTLTARGLTIGGATIASGRGWIRRLAPEGWAGPLNSGSLVAAERSSALSALAVVLHDERIEWLTPIGLLGAAE